MNGILLDQTFQHGVPVLRGAVVYHAGDGRLPTAGPGTKASRDGNSLVAVVDGLAVTTPDSVSVLEAQLIHDDVESGRTLSAPGNLVITGKVGKDALVRAGGFLLVVGPVFWARVEAMGSVVLRAGCNGSTVDAGVNRQTFITASDRVRSLDGSLRKLLAVLDQLKSLPAFRTLDLQEDLRPLLEVLVERTFAGLPAEVADVRRRLSSVAHVGGPVAELDGLLGRRFAGSLLLHLTRRIIEQGRDLAADAVIQLTELSATPFSVWVTGGPVLDSAVRAPGDVVVADGDCRRSQVSGGSVRVEGRILGGSVSAARSIEAHTVVDSPVLEVTGNGFVRLRGVVDAPTLRIGHLTVNLSAVPGPSVIRQVGDRLEIHSETEAQTHA